LVLDEIELFFVLLVQEELGVAQLVESLKVDASVVVHKLFRQFHVEFVALVAELLDLIARFNAGALVFLASS